MPRRTLGRTQAKIPILLLGGALDFDPILDPRLAEGLRFGINYFDTADCYAGGASEIGIGGFLETTGQRPAVWLTTKADDHTPAGLTTILQRSLMRLKTDHVDMLLLHRLTDAKFLTPDLARCADELKQAGKIRFFGFTCQDQNVAELVAKAAELPWIDALMFPFRQSADDKLNQAVDAAATAGVGLIAMLLPDGPVPVGDDIQKFADRGGGLQAIWDDDRITAVVSEMDTLEKMKQSIMIALDQAKESSVDHLQPMD